MANGIRTGDPPGFNKGRSLKFREGSRVFFFILYNLYFLKLYFCVNFLTIKTKDKFKNKYLYIFLCF